MTQDIQTDAATRSLLIARLSLNLLPASPAPIAAHVRGALAGRYPELDLLHQHGSEGLIYRSPRVLYGIHDGAPVVTAIEEGAQELMKVQLVGSSLILGKVNHTVADATLRVTQEQFGQSSKPLHYQFHRPWLALNQKNHRTWQDLDAAGRTDFLNRQICNNCLAVAKSFDVRISQRLVAKTDLRSVTVRHKGLPMTGLTGSFEVNFHISDGMGLGKSVAKGFGTVRELKPYS